MAQTMSVERESGRPARADDRAPLARRREREPAFARIPGRARRRLGRGVVGGGRRGCRRARARAARARHRQGRRVRDPRADDARVGALRLRAQPRRRDRRPHLREQLGEGRRSSSPTTPRPSAFSARTTAQLAKLESLGLEHAWTFADLDELRARGREHAVEQPNAVARRGRQGRRGRPVHVHLHLGNDRPAQGLHDPPPQLLRDGRRRRRARASDRRGRPAPALSAARAQLRPAHAPRRPVRRLHDRVPARSAAHGGRAAPGAAHGAAERAARVREGARRRPREVRRGDRREAAHRRLGAAASGAASAPRDSAARGSP